MGSRGSSATVIGSRADKLAKPYSMDWMDSCYQETLLPGSPWHKVNGEICDVLAEYLPKQMSQMQRASVLARILGDAFMVKYFPDVLTAIANDPRDIAPEDEKKLTLEASSWLKSQLIKAAKQVGSLIEEDGEYSEKMKEFRSHTSQAFYNGLDRELFHQEQQAIAAVKQAAQLKQETRDTVALESVRQHPASPTKSAVSSSRSTPVQSVKTEKVRATLYNLDDVPQHPSMTSRSIELIAESVVKLLEKSPRRFETVAKRLHGRLLPTKLRVYVWTECLYRAERDKLARGANVERILRERFGKTVARNVGELRLTRATQSPIHRLIENSTLEVYDTVPALAACRSRSMIKDAIKALNILYTYDKTYEPYLILWLFPLQLTFSEQALMSGPEYVYELAMYLDVLNSSLFMQWSQVYAIADLSMHHLLRNDRDFHNHLHSICQLNVHLKTEDFILEHMQKERREAQKMLKKPAETEVDSQQLLTDPRIYIRKWIGEGFVSVLDTPAVMFVWDQLFLQDWNSTVLQDFTLVVMLLLRERFMLCTDHMSMRAVFLDEPCKLLLADIQQAWLLLHEQKSYLEIAACNRVRPAQSTIVESSLGDQSVLEDFTPLPEDPLPPESVLGGQTETPLSPHESITPSPSVPHASPSTPQPSIRGATAHTPTPTSQALRSQADNDL